MTDVKRLDEAELSEVSGGNPVSGALQTAAGIGGAAAEGSPADFLNAPNEAQDAYNDQSNPNQAAPHDGEYTPQDSIYDGTNSAP